MYITIIKEAVKNIYHQYYKQIYYLENLERNIYDYTMM